MWLAVRVRNECIWSLFRDANCSQRGGSEAFVVSYLRQPNLHSEVKVCGCRLAVASETASSQYEE